MTRYHLTKLSQIFFCLLALIASLASCGKVDNPGAESESITAGVTKTSAICGSIDSDITIESGYTVTWAGGCLYDKNITIKTGGIFRVTGPNGDISGVITLAGGTLDIDDSVTVSGNMEQTGSSTIDIASGKALTYSGNALNIGANTLTLPGDGGISNGVNRLNLNSASAVLKIDGATTIQGDVGLSGGTLDVNENATIEGKLLHPLSSTIDVQNGKTLTYNNSTTIELGTNTLTLTGQGTFLNTALIDLNTSSSRLRVGGAITLQGNIRMAGGTLDVDESFTYSGTLTRSAAVTVDVATGKTFTYSGSSIDISSDALTLTGAGTLAANLNLAGNTLTVLDSITVSGNITYTASSIIDVASGKTCTYTGSTLNIGSSTMTFSGGGTFSSTNPLTLNNANSVLKLDGSGGTIGNVAVTGADIASGHGIDVNNSFTITTLTQGANNVEMDILSGRTLTLTNAYTPTSAETLTLTGGGTLTTNGSLTVAGTVTNTGTVTIDANNDLTINTGGTLTLGSGTLDMTGSGSDLTVNTGGSLTLGTGSINITNTTVSLYVNLNTSSGTLTTSGTNLSLGADITLTSAQTIAIQNLSLNDHALTLGDATSDLSVAALVGAWDSAGERIITGGADLTLPAALSVTNGRVTSSGGTITLNGSGTFSSALLDLSGSKLVLGGDLNAAGGTLTCDATTDLTLTANATITSGSAITLRNLDLSNHTLTLGDASSDLSVSNSLVTPLDQPSESIVTQLADLTLTPSLTVSGGASITSTGGTVTLSGATVDASSRFDITGTSLILGGDLTTGGAALISDSSTDLTLTANATLTSGNGLTLENLDLGGFTLTLGSATSDVTVGVAVTSGLNSANERIVTGLADLSVSPVLTLTAGADITSTGGTITVSDVTVDTATSSLDLTNTTLILGGNLNTAGGSLITTASTNLTLTADATLTSDSPVRLNTLNLGDKLLTLGSATTDVTLSTISGGIDNASEGVITAGADFSVANSLIMTDGRISSSGGALILNGSISGVGSDLAITGGTVTLNGNLAVGPNTLNTAGSSWDTSDDTLSLTTGNTFAGGIAIQSGGTLNSSTNVTISGNITCAGTATLDIDSGTTLTYTGATPIPVNCSSLILNDMGTFAGNLNLAGGSLSANESVTISGNITHTADSTIDITSSKTLTYSGANINVNAFTLALNAGDSATFSSSNYLVLNTTTSKLVLTGPGTGTATVGRIAINGADIASGSGIDTDKNYTITTLTQGANNAEIDILAGKTLTVSNTYTPTAAETLTLTGGGTLTTNGPLTIAGTVTNSGTVTVDANNDLTINTGGTLTMGSGTLDMTASGSDLTVNTGGSLTLGTGTINVTNTTVSLYVNLDTSSGTLTTSGTNLNLGADITLTSAQPITIQNLNLNDHALMLGSATSDLSIENTIAAWNNPNERIDTQGADLSVTRALTISNGQITSTGGTVSLLDNGGYAFADGTCDIRGTELKLGGNFTTSTATLLSDASTDLTLVGNATLTTGSSLSVRNLDLGNRTLTLGDTTSDLTVTTSVVGGLNSSGEGITTGLADLTITPSLRVTNNAQITSGGGTITLGDATFDGSSTLNISGTTLILNGDLRTTNATLISNSSTNLTINPDVTLTCDDLLEVGTLDLTSNTLTLGDQDSDVSVDTAILNLTGANGRILTGAADFAVGSNITLTGGSDITSNGGTLTLRDITVNNASSILDLTGTTLILGGDLNADGGVLTTSASTNLTLTTNATLTSDSVVTINTLSLGDHLLTLGDATSDMTVSSINGAIDNASEGIATGGADLTVTSPLSMSDGAISSSGGALILNGTVSGSNSSIGITGGTVTLNGNLSLGPNTLTTTGSTWDTSGDRLSLTKDSTFDGDIVISGGSLDTSTDVTISGNITYSGPSSINIHNANTLSYTNGTPISVSSSTLSFNQNGQFAGNIILNGGTLSIRESMTISGDITHTADSTVDIASTKTVTYSGADVSIGASTLILNAGDDAVFSNANNLVLNNANSKLLLTGSGSGKATVSKVSVSGANIASGFGIDTDKNYFITTLTQGANNAEIDILAGKSLTLSDAYTPTAGSTLTLVGGGTLITGGPLTVAGTVTQSGSVTLDVSSDIRINNGGTLNLGAGTLNLSRVGSDFSIVSGGALTTGAGAINFSNSTVTLDTNLDVSNATLTTGNTNLDLSSDITLTAGQPLTIQTLGLNDHALTLGDASTDMKITALAAAWDNAGERIITQAADVTFDTAIHLTNGQITSSGGNITFSGTANINANTLNVSGTTVTLGGDATIDVATLTSNASTVWIPGSNTLAWSGAGGNFNGAMTIPTGGRFKTVSNAGTVLSPIVLSGGTLDVDVTTDFPSGAISHTASSTIDVNSGATLSYGGTAINIGPHTLSVSGAGTIDNTNDIILNDASSDLTLRSTGGGTIAKVSITGATLTTGRIHAVENFTITDLSVVDSARINLETGKTLTIANNLTIPTTKSLTLIGSGTLDLNAAFSIVSGASVSGGSASIDLSDPSSDLLLNGTLNAGTGTLTFGPGITSISGTLFNINGTTVTQTSSATLGVTTLNSDASTDWTIPAGQSLSWNGLGGTLSGKIHVNGAGSEFRTYSNSALLASEVNLNGGTLSIDVNTEINSSGKITHTSDSTIDIQGIPTLTYNGSDILIGSNRLTFSGPGTIDNSNPIVLDKTDSILSLSGGGTISLVDVSADIDASSGILVSSNATITNLTLRDDCRIVVSSGSLTIGNNLTVAEDPANDPVHLTLSGSVTIHDLILYESLDISGDITLSNDSSLVVMKTATFSPGSDLTFKDGLYVADGATLTLSDDAPYTVTIRGGVNIVGSGAVVVGNNVTLVLEYPSPDSGTLDKITVTGSGKLIPLKPITNFTATGGVNRVDLSWTKSNTSLAVLVKRSTMGYPSFPAEGSQIYDGTSDTGYTDNAGLTAGLTYYYSAFTHTDGTNDYTAARNASATPTDATPDYYNDVTHFTATPGDGYIRLSWDSTTDTAGVRIVRASDTYPDSTTDGEVVYNGSDTSTDDKGLSHSTGYKGLLNGRLYFYRAFAYNSSGQFAPGVNAVAATATVPSGLVSYYPFSGNHADGSGKGNHGESYGNADLTSDMRGRANQAFTFDGAGDYIEIENPVEDDFTIAFWFRSTQAGGSSAGQWYGGWGLVDGKIGTGQSDFGTSLGDGKVMFGTGNTDSTIKTSVNYNDGKWYHVAVTRNKGMGDISLFIQGHEVATGTGNTLSLNASSLLRIGSSPQSSTDYFQGDMDDIKIYNRELNQTEIERLYFSTVAKIKSTISSSDLHGCLIINAADTSNDIRCWGDTGPSAGRLGNGSTSGIHSRPVETSGITNAVQISAAHNHSCAVLADGTINCWGEGSNGKLGNGSVATHTTPVQVSGISNAIQVATGSEHSCAVLDNIIGGTIKCWGDDSSGQIGDGANTGGSTPHQVSSVSTAIQVGTGLDFSCALLNNKKVACWGSEANGRLCNGSTTGQKSTPVLTSVTSAVQISVGRTHACALLENGTIQCWGEGNANARMGDGSSSSDNSAPRTVSGISTAVQVVAGYAHTCALLADGTIKCWGKNGSSQLGDHGTTTANTPVSVTDVTGDATALSLGKASTCAVFANGTVKCWGKGSNGELGNDSTADSVSPVAVYGLDNNAKQ